MPDASADIEDHPELPKKNSSPYAAGCSLKWSEMINFVVPAQEGTDLVCKNSLGPVACGWGTDGRPRRRGIVR